MTRLCSVAAIAWLIATTASAQVPTQTQWSKSAACGDTDKPGTITPATLSKQFYAGDWSALTTDLETLLVKKCGIVDPVELRKEYFLVVFTAQEPKPTPEVLHVLFHKPPSDPFPTSLPGVGIKDSPTPLREIFVSDTPTTGITSLFTVTQAANPILAQVGSFVQSFDFTKFTPASAQALTQLAQRKDKLGPYVAYGTVTLPYKRASIAESDFGEIAAPLEMGAAAAKLNAPLDVVHSTQQAFATVLGPCASSLNEKLYSALKDVAKKPETHWEDMPGLVNRVVKEGLAGCSRADRIQAQAVADAYRGLIATPQAQKLTGTATLTNTPLSWVNFTAASGVIIGQVSGAEKVKIDNKVYAADPPGRGLTMAALALHLPYDSTRPEPSKRERVGFLLGGVITPAGGFGTALSVTLVRGLSVNVGGAALIVPARRGSKNNGDAPDDPNRPFETGWAFGWFIGGNYTFK